MTLRKCSSGIRQHQNGCFQYSINITPISLLFFKAVCKILIGGSFQSAHQVFYLSKDTECRQLPIVLLVTRSDLQEATCAGIEAASRTIRTVSANENNPHPSAPQPPAPRHYNQPGKATGWWWQPTNRIKGTGKEEWSGRK